MQSGKFDNKSSNDEIELTPLRAQYPRHGRIISCNSSANELLDPVETVE